MRVITTTNSEANDKDQDGNMSRQCFSLPRQRLKRTTKKCCDKVEVLKANYVAALNSELAMKDKKALLRHKSFMSRQTKHKVGMNPVTTWTFIVAIKAEKGYKKNVATFLTLLRLIEELKAEFFVTTTGS